MTQEYRQTVHQQVVIKAGAGAGKTTELVRRVLGLAKEFLETKNRPPKLVITTFTVKATQELRERLLSKAMESGDRRLTDFAQSKSLLQVGTIHSVFLQFLRQYGSRVGCSVDLQILDGADELQMRRRLLRETIEEQITRPGGDSLQGIFGEIRLRDLELILFELATVRQENQQSVLIPLTQIQGQIENQWKNWLLQMDQVFTVIAQSETTPSWRQWISVMQDFLSFCHGLEGKFKSQSFWEIQPKLAGILEELPIARRSKSSDPAIHDLRQELIEQLKSFASENHSLEWITAHQNFAEKILGIEVSFQKNLEVEKRRSQRFSMGDIENLCERLIQEDPQSAAQFSKNFDYWMIDEFQDTSPRQIRTLEKLIGESLSFKVGDPQQSIYLFRGARSEVFSEEIEKNKKRGGTNQLLDTNFRSHPQVMRFINRVFENLGSQFHPMQSGKGPEHFEKDAQIVFWSQQKTSTEKPEDVGGTMSAGDFEVNAALLRCQELLKSGVNPEDIVVLSRRNRDLENLAILSFELGLPVQVHSGGAFYRRREIRDALSILQFLVNPHDNNNFIEMLRAPWFHMTDPSIAAMVQTRRNLKANSLWVSALTIKELSATDGGFGSTMTRLKGLTQTSENSGIGTAWREALSSSGLLAFSQEIDPSGRRYANLWKLVTLLNEEERSPDFSYSEFITKSWQFLEVKDQDSDAVSLMESGRISLMTIHASKGLEFDHVVLLGTGYWRPQQKFARVKALQSGLWFKLYFPSQEDGKWLSVPVGSDERDMIAEMEFAEYDRLFYVALTRAKLGLTLIQSRIDKNSWGDRMWKPLQEDVDSKEFGQISYRWGIPSETQNEVSRSTEANAKRTSLQNETDSPSVAKPVIGTESRQLIRISVSRLLDGTNREANQQALRAAFSPSHQDRLRFLIQAQAGVDLHKALQRSPSIQSDEILRPKLEFLETKGNRQITSVLSSGHREWSFLVASGEFVVQGQIDLWGKDDEGNFWVLDYKTGSSRYLDKARQQLRIYTWALQKCGQIPSSAKIFTAAIYVEEQICDVQELTVPAGLEGFVQDLLAKQRKLKIPNSKAKALK